MVRLPRSAELIAAIWGVLKAGGAYLPLDPHLPVERLHFTLEDAAADVMITLDGLTADVPAGLGHLIRINADWEAIESASRLRSIETDRQSSPGIRHLHLGLDGPSQGSHDRASALVNYARAAAQLYSISADDRVLQFASASYDAHVEEVYPCLLRGGTLVLRSEEMLDCRRFLEQCDAWRLTFVTVPTAFWHELTLAIKADSLALPSSLRMLVIGGEAASPERLAMWFERVGTHVRLFNTYGPTEATVIATAASMGRVDAETPNVSIGRAACPMCRPMSSIGGSSPYRSACRANCTLAAPGWRRIPEPPGTDGGKVHHQSYPERP